MFLEATFTRSNARETQKSVSLSKQEFYVGKRRYGSVCTAAQNLFDIVLAPVQDQVNV